MTVWSNPVIGRISSPYGRRAKIKTGHGETATFHAGVDVVAPTGAPVHAASAGSVIYAGPAGNGLTAGRSGLCVLIRHPSGQDSYYGHLQVIRVRVGQDVATGQRIGDVGATGRVTGPHLHFEIRPAAGVIGTTDPGAFLAGRGVRIGADRITVELRPVSRSRDDGGLLVDGDMGRETITALQRALAGVGKDVGPADGKLGPRTIRAYQQWLTQCGFDSGPIDGELGRRTVLAEQRWLRSHGLYPYGLDGERGARTVAALQAALNRGVIR